MPAVSDSGSSSSDSSSEDEMHHQDASDQEGNAGGDEQVMSGEGEGHNDSDKNDIDEDDDGDSDDSSDSDGRGGPASKSSEIQFDEDHDVPAVIKFDSDPTCVSFHPTADVLATGTIDGELMLWKYGLEKNEEVIKAKPFAKACRGVEFTPDGKTLFTISKDKSWKMIDAETMQVLRDMKKAHKCALYSLAYIDEWLFATGDEDGGICVWDHRTPKQEAVQTYKESEDYIADLLIEPQQRKVLLAASTEGTLTAIDVRRKKMIMQSELFEEEFLSLALIKGKKVVCGCSEGSLEIFNWEEFGYMVNAMKSVSKASIDTMVSLADNIVVYGCGDGNVRAASLFPNKPLGIIGKHCDFPVMSLRLDREKKIAASVSADQTLRFWSVQGLESKLNLKKGRTQDLQMAMNTRKNNFFSGLVGDGEGPAD